MKPDWLPDWDDAKAYPKPKDLDWGQWAWQFLRRSPEYQKDYENWQALIDTLPADCNRLPSPEEDIRFSFFDPPAKAGETYKEYLKRVGGPWRRTMVATAMPEKYGFRPILERRLASERPWLECGLVPPEQEIFTGVFFTENSFRALHSTPELRNYKHQLQVREFEAWVSFNLEWPINIQIKRVRQWLDKYQSYLKKDCGLQPIQTRNQIKKFPYYIRLLDAKASDADVKTMAACLLPEQENEHPEFRADKNIRQALSSAKRLRDRDYRFIALKTRTK
ncbi:MAG: hypothetical protein IH900_02035 [Proteobacteria bacterium]|nr:hypothetical protein [Pseudomonadota bacterium]